ncbi:MAG TPA: YciI family protein [Chitinophagaceae bacterium]|nr:YciI family protein [Chitinophagaceae bacterium]
MKKIPLLALLLLAIMLASAQTPDPSDQKPENTIRKYYFVMLLKGPNRNQDSVTAAKIQEGHLANINRLYHEGKLKVAGPSGDDSGWLGIFIFDCNSQEELETLLKTDPAIAAGRIRYDIHPWYTAAIGSFAPGKPKE